MRTLPLPASLRLGIPTQTAIVAAVITPYRSVVLVVGILLALLPAPAFANSAIPATSVMTLYQFNGPAKIPYYDVDAFLRRGPASPAGTLTQGTSVIPCLVIRGGKPLTDDQGTPYVGFEIVVDSDAATPASTAHFEQVWAQRKTKVVANHHCPVDTRHVVDVRKFHTLGKPPRFDPPPPQQPGTAAAARGELDHIVRAFHESTHCELANRRLVGRREALQRAWSAFITEKASRWPTRRLTQARHLDFVMRTAIYEGHLGRGCGAYGACERNVIALSIRNRAVERCLRGQGCRSEGDFEGVASAVSQYNIWDEYLTQTSGLTSCFLRSDLMTREVYAKLQALYEQSAADVESILFGNDADLRTRFIGSSTAKLSQLRHYYHPPAMGKCFPDNRRLEYVTGAVARRGDTYALIANTRIHVGEKRGDGYLFEQVEVGDINERDVVKLRPLYPGFVIDGRKIEMQAATRCTPYGVRRACRFKDIGRHRKTPSWLDAGEPLQVSCRVHARGQDCRSQPTTETVQVGGLCDTDMQPFAGVP